MIGNNFGLGQTSFNMFVVTLCLKLYKVKRGGGVGTELILLTFDFDSLKN